MLNRLTVCRFMAFVAAILPQKPLFAAADPWQLNMYRGVTPISQDIYNLHMICMVVCAIIGVVVFGVMLYSLIYHRQARGFKPAKFHDNLRLEIVWSIIPLLILVGLAIPATRVLMRMDNTDDSTLTIKVVGYQWRWQYQYLDQGISFFSNLSTPYQEMQNKQKKGQWYLLEVDKPLVVPIHKKIRFLVTANDVIHSWWVPELGIKRDAIPGFMHEAWASIEKPGVYRGQCAELCGINHGFMPIVVQALPVEEFDRWVAAQPKVEDQYAQTTPDALDHPVMSWSQLMSKGKKTYEMYCAACHKSDGTGLPPMYPPLKGSSIAVGHPISRHLELILNGVPGSGMQPYRDQLTNEEIAALATYERNAWGNNTGDEVQPAEVAGLRTPQKPTLVKKQIQTGGLR
jgi:cytochrome c oxidase subunit 2